MNDFSTDKIEKMINDVESIYEKYGLTDEERDTILITISAFCHYQLEMRQGLFYDTVKHLLKESS